MVLTKVVKRMLALAARVPPLRPVVIAGFELRKYVPGWRREHPYDRSHGVRTSGTLPNYVLQPGDPLNVFTTGYVAVQPSIIRTALAAIPDTQRCHFLDLGCGKGRALFVAAEFGFAHITGVELNPGLSRIARRNVAKFSRRNPHQTRINVVTGDALAHLLPSENIVIFLYNPFGHPLIERVLVNIEASLRAKRRDLYIVYCNPIWAEVFDASDSLERRYAAKIPYDPSEIGYGPSASDMVIIWQNRNNPHPRPPGDPFARVVVISPGQHVELAEHARSDQ